MASTAEGFGYVDTHYTPSALAATLVQAASAERPKLVADLAVGNGDLLLAAEHAWPAARFVGTDIDPRAVRRLSRLRPSWTVGRCDLRNARSRRSCLALKSLRNSASLLLLNPPFSCRGGTRFSIPTASGPMYASTALSFLLLATDYLAQGGHVACILPLGCLHNEKDMAAWKQVESQFHVEVIDHCSIRTFPDAAANTVLVRLSPRSSKEAIPRSPTISRVIVAGQFCVRIIRGCCPMHRMRLDVNKPPLVHYTDLRDGRVRLNGRQGFGTYRCVTGPAILLPRVGQFTLAKIATLPHGLKVMLSDCVLALKPTHREFIVPLRQKLVDNFFDLRGQYTGTGAPFITLRRLQCALRAIGISVYE